MNKTEFFDCFKLATVGPVFKKDDSNNINTIDQLVYYQIFQNYLKKLCIIDCNHF